MKNSETTPEVKAEPLSAVLKKARLANDLTIDYIVSETRISKHVIEQMESDKPHNLPEPVFLKGFIKAYAELVGLDPDEVMKLYLAENGITETPPETPEQHIATNAFANRKKNYVPQIICVLIVVAVLAVIALTTMEPGTENEDVVSQQNTEVAAEEVQKNKKIVNEYKLEVECVEETLLKISTDGEEVVEYNMLPEEHLELKAEKNFNILITNTCGVTLFLNDKVVNVPGKCGQTANLYLPQKQ